MFGKPLHLEGGEALPRPGPLPLTVWDDLLQVRLAELYAQSWCGNGAGMKRRRKLLQHPGAAAQTRRGVGDSAFGPQGLDAGAALPCGGNGE